MNTAIWGVVLVVLVSLVLVAAISYHTGREDGLNKGYLEGLKHGTQDGLEIGRKYPRKSKQNG